MDNNCGEIMKVSYNEDGTIMYVEGKTDHGGVLTKMEMFDARDNPAIMSRATYALYTEFDDKGQVVDTGKTSIRWDGDNYDSANGRNRQPKTPIN